MIDPDDAHCFPICRGCREAGICPKGPSLATLKAEAPPKRNWQPNDLPVITLECGCRSLPWPEWLDKAIGISKVWCPTHEIWCELPEESDKKTPGKKGKRQIPGQGNLLDIPPY